MWDIGGTPWKGWYPTTLLYLESVAGLTLDAKHLWLNESLGGVKTPLMLVQATPSVNGASMCKDFLAPYCLHPLHTSSYFE